MREHSALTNMLLALTITCAGLGSALAQDFLPYEGKNAIQEGEGGTKKVIEGVDFWADGAPPRTFKLLGYITDRRHKSGLVGMIRMSGLEGDVAKVAKENGGDAVILVSSEAETVGTVGGSYGQMHANANTFHGNTTAQGSGWSTGATSAVQKQQSKYAVVKYIEVKKASESSSPSTPAKDEPQGSDAKPPLTPAAN